MREVVWTRARRCKRSTAAKCRGGLRRCVALPAATRGRTVKPTNGCWRRSQGCPSALRQVLRLGRNGGLLQPTPRSTTWWAMSRRGAPAGDEDDPGQAGHPGKPCPGHGGSGSLHGNQLGEAWDRIAPPTQRLANPDGRYAVYRLANARGWPRRAEEEAQIVASLALNNIEGSRDRFRSRLRWPTASARPST